MGSLTFIRAAVGPFQGINVDQPIIIEFPRTRGKKRPMGKITGDSKQGKSSFIHFLLHATGQQLGFKQANLINTDHGEMKGEHEFEAQGNKWRVRFSRTKFELHKLFKSGKDEAWIPQSDPATMVKKLIGTVAVSPMKLRTDDGEKQVTWLFQLLNVPQKVLDEDKRIRDQIKVVTQAHSKANKTYTFLKTELNENPMYLNYEASALKYAEDKTVELLQKKMEDATKKKAQLDGANEKITTITRNISTKETEIKDLEGKLEQARGELKKLKETKKAGEDFVRTVKNASVEYDNVHKEFITISTYLAEQGQWKEVKRKKAEMDEFEDYLVEAAGSKDRLNAKKRANLANILPDIPGLEVITEDEIDGKKMGVYSYGLNPIQMSESELFDLYFKICEFLGVQMIVIENITSFGSDVIRTLNELANAGVYIWYTQMARGQQELKIEFVDKLV